MNACDDDHGRGCSKRKEKKKLSKDIITIEFDVSVVPHYVFFFWAAHGSHLEPGYGQLATKAIGEVEARSWLTGVTGCEW